MKTINFLKKARLSVTFASAILIMGSCEHQDQMNSNETAEVGNDEKFDKNKQEKDAQFLVKAAESNLKQIQLGQLARQKGTTPDVKELGKIMESEHSKSLNELETLAKNKMVTIPTSLTNDARDDYNDLNEKSGNDFDKAYADMMVSEHKNVIEDYEDASDNSYDSDIKNWASGSLSNLRKHHEHSVKCQEKIDKTQ